MFGVYKRNIDGTEEILMRTGDFQVALQKVEELKKEYLGVAFFIRETENASITPR